jgi:hypothetical protein
MRYNTTGGSNTAVGYQALLANTTGNTNTAMGFGAGYSNKTGSRSTLVGYHSGLYMCDTTVDWTAYNTAVGYQALRGASPASGNTGTYNSAFGDSAGYAMVSGANNALLGYAAGTNINSGSKNTFVGSAAGLRTTTGSDNVAIGYNAGAYYNTNQYVADPTNCIYIGDSTQGSGGSPSNEIVIGQGAVGLGNNTAIIGNSSIDVMRLYSDAVGIGTSAPESIIHGNISTSADIAATIGCDSMGSYLVANRINTAGFDARGKTAAGSLRYASVRVMKHSGITDPCAMVLFQLVNAGFRFVWVDDNGDMRISNTNTHVGTTSGTVVGAQTSDIRLKRNVKPLTYGLDEIMKIEPIKFTRNNVASVGFSAQQIKPIIPEAVTDTKEPIEGDSEKTKLVMEYTQIVPVLVKAVQEQQAIIESLKLRIKALEDKQ